MVVCGKTFANSRNFTCGIDHATRESRKRYTYVARKKQRSSKKQSSKKQMLRPSVVYFAQLSRKDKGVKDELVLSKQRKALTEFWVLARVGGGGLNTGVERQRRQHCWL